MSRERGKSSMSAKIMVSIDLTAYPDARIICDESGGGELQRGVFIPIDGSGFKVTRSGRVKARVKIVRRGVEVKGEREFDVIALCGEEHICVGGGVFWRKQSGYTNMIEVINDNDNEQEV